MKTDEPFLLTEKQAAKFLGISLPTIIRWRHSGELPHIKVGSRTVKYLRESLLNRIKSLEIGGHYGRL